jgi:DNA-binding transcriptional ArsR family regulator
MIEAIVGNATVEKVLLFLQTYGHGYAREISETFRLPLSQVQKQLRRLEDGGVVVSRRLGRTRLFEWNPRYPFLRPLRELLAEVLRYVPEDELQRYYRQRRRPRREGKPQ